MIQLDASQHAAVDMVTHEPPVDAELQTDDLTFEYLVRSIPSEQ